MSFYVLCLIWMPQYFIDKNTDDKEKFSKQEMSV